MTDIGLYPVLRTRPGLTPPQICLPSTLSDTGHTCTSTHAFASGFLQAGIAATTLAFGYPSPPSGWVWTLPDICVTIPDITIKQPGQARHTTSGFTKDHSYLAACEP